MESELQDSQEAISSSQNHKVTSTSFAAKYRSKREIYNLLTVDVGAYLPPFETVTIYYLKDIISGKKKCKYTKYPLLLICYFL